MNQTKSVTGTLNQSGGQIKVDVQGFVSAVIQLTGTFVATAAFEYTVNGSDWYSLSAITVDVSGKASSSTTAGRWFAKVAGFQAIRVKLSSFTSGSVNVYLRASAADHFLLDLNSDGSVNINQKTALAGENLPLDTQGVTQKPVVSSSYSGQAFTNFGAASNASVTTVPTMIKSIRAHNENAAVRYLQVFNLAAAPTEDTSVPLFSFTIPAGTAAAPGVCSVGAEFFGEAGYYLSAGLSWGISVDKDNWDSTGVTVTEHIVNGVRV